MRVTNTIIMMIIIIRIESMKYNTNNREWMKYNNTEHVKFIKIECVKLQ